MGTVTLTLGDTTVVIDAKEVDGATPWTTVVNRLLIPALAAQGYMVESLYELEELKEPF